MALTSCCTTWTCHLFSIFWFTLAFSISVTLCKQLDTEEKVLSKCGNNVTLTCKASTSMLKDSNLIKFEWQFKNGTLCQYKHNNSTSKFQCNRTNTTTELSLTLTILNITPTDDGVYHCKLASSNVVANGKSKVEVQECLGKYTRSMDDTFAKCSFQVFPSGNIHWYQKGLNLTEEARVDEMSDENGYYTIDSKLPIDKGNKNLPYNCSLWMPSLNGYYTSQLVTSSGSRVQLHYIYIMIGIWMRIGII